MDPGRKILNLRKDRGIWQKDLASACGVTASVVTKLETGRITDPWAEVLLKIANRLAVPVDYLLDESQPYPYEPLKWRETVSKADRKKTTRMRVTKEEQAFLEALRRLKKRDRELAYSVPEMPLDVLWMVGRVMTRGE